MRDDSHIGTKHKTPDLLDAMIEHVRYEAVQVVNWATWLTIEAPVVLRAFRDFRVLLHQLSPRRYEPFVQPRDALPVIDLVPMLDSMLGDT